MIFNFRLLFKLNKVEDSIYRKNVIHRLESQFNVVNRKRLDKDFIYRNLVVQRANNFKYNDKNYPYIVNNQFYYFRKRTVFSTVYLGILEFILTVLFVVMKFIFFCVGSAYMFVVATYHIIWPFFNYLLLAKYSPKDNKNTEYLYSLYDRLNYVTNTYNSYKKKIGIFDYYEPYVTEEQIEFLNRFNFKEKEKNKFRRSRLPYMWFFLPHFRPWYAVQFDNTSIAKNTKVKNGRDVFLNVLNLYELEKFILHYEKKNYLYYYIKELTNLSKIYPNFLVDRFAVAEMLNPFDKLEMMAEDERREDFKFYPPQSNFYKKDVLIRPVSFLKRILHKIQVLFKVKIPYSSIDSFFVEDSRMVFINDKKRTESKNFKDEILVNPNLMVKPFWEEKKYAEFSGEHKREIALLYNAFFFEKMLTETYKNDPESLAPIYSKKDKKTSWSTAEKESSLMPQRITIPYPTFSTNLANNVYFGRIAYNDIFFHGEAVCTKHMHKIAKERVKRQKRGRKRMNQSAILIPTRFFYKPTKEDFVFMLEMLRNTAHTTSLEKIQLDDIFLYLLFTLKKLKEETNHPIYVLIDSFISIFF